MLHCLYRYIYESKDILTEDIIVTKKICWSYKVSTKIKKTIFFLSMQVVFRTAPWTTYSFHTTRRCPTTNNFVLARLSKAKWTS